MGERLVQPERGEDDPRDEQEMKVRIGVAGELVPLLARRHPGQPSRACDCDDVEVEPPKRADEGDAENGRCDHPESQAEIIARAQGDD